MKTLLLTLIACITLNLATTVAQQANITSLPGKWAYESPKKKSKVVYDFALDNSFIFITERNENEIIVKGTYQTDKVNELDRLKLSMAAEGDQTKTIINSYFIKFVSADSIKVQPLNGKQEKWLKENKRNTMVFTRQKDKKLKE